MPLKSTLQDDIKDALRAKDTPRLSALRLLMAAIKQREIDERVERDDTGFIATVEKLVKQRRDAAQQYDQANRPELAAAERAEIEFLSKYLPAALSEAEIEQAVQTAIAETAATGAADMGKVMGVLKPRLAGRADMSAVSRLVRAQLN